MTNKILINFHNLIIRCLTGFILIKEVRQRVRDLFFIQVESKKNNNHNNIREYYTWFTHEKIKVGKNTYFGIPCRIISKDTRIGNFCSVSWNVNIGTSFHPTNWLTTHMFTYSQARLDLYDIHLKDENILNYCGTKACTIKNDVWIGCNVTIMDGITINDGAIIGAGSVVTKDVPPYAIVAGVPAKIIRYRFDEKTIQELLDLKWWNLKDDIIKTLPFDDVQKCIKILKKIRNNA